MRIAVVGTETISADYATEKRFIEVQIPVALGVVGSEMMTDLLGHIQEDWYVPYSPKVYKRRTDDGSLGTPLGDTDNISAEVRGFSLDFDFSPSGEHQNEAWSDRHGDELVTWIQTGTDDIPPRPFWNNFLEEQKNGGIMNAFILGMGARNAVIAEGGDDDVVFDGSESMLPS